MRFRKEVVPVATLGSFLEIGVDQGINIADRLDVVNMLRTRQYVENFGLSGYATHDCLDSVHYPAHRQGPFVSPAADSAWWYDPCIAESANFFGFAPISVDGFFGNDIERTSTPLPSGGSVPFSSMVGSSPLSSTHSGYYSGNSIVHGPIVEQGYTVVIEALAVGATCCSIAFGIRALRQALRQRHSTFQCYSTRLSVLTCSPGTAEQNACFPTLPTAAETARIMEVGNAALATDVEIVRQQGRTCGNCGCSKWTVVRWTWRTNPGMYTPLAQIVTQTADPSQCNLPCDTSTPFDTAIADPTSSGFTRPGVPAMKDSAFCDPLFASSAWFNFDLTAFCATFPVQLHPVVTSGGALLKGLSVRIWENTGAPAQDPTYNDGTVIAGFGVSYVPATSTWTFDAIERRAYITTPDGVLHAADSTLSGPGGGPLRIPMVLSPGRNYIAELRVDPLYTDAGASVQLWGREVWP